MKDKTDVLVIGGSAAGIVVATTGKSHYPDKDFLLVRKEQKVLVPCGIPYIFGSLDSSEKNLIPDATLSDNKVRLKIDEAIAVDPQKKLCRTADGTEIEFDKLIFATGSTPVAPQWLKGVDKGNVFSIHKDKVVIDVIKEKLKDASKVIVIGGGFIGVEMADEINKYGKDVTLVELLPNILSLAFDEELAVKAEDILESRGVTIRTGEGVQEILGEENVSGVLLKNGETLAADVVILAMGYRPNVSLARQTGININDLGFICVDEYMRTCNNSDIFAIGDCAEKKGFIMGMQTGVMLASTACAEARIAGMNLFSISAVKTFGGTISMFCTVIGDTAFGAAGIIESRAKELGLTIVTGTFEGIDKHPGTLPGTQKQTVKLIVAKESGNLIGGEVIGGAGTGELINLIGFSIENRITIASFITAQIATHPLLTGPPTAYPLIKAAEAAAKKRKFVS
ncbi:MAG: FAD-dependent oxidoreductase [Candidatus Marinimicrobia bacterium]|nr:FAD-dependent oxidoreductase [Candidatus Neomarinimicrobiota bacterium]